MPSIATIRDIALAAAGAAITSTAAYVVYQERAASAQRGNSYETQSYEHRQESHEAELARQAEYHHLNMERARNGQQPIQPPFGRY
ncbi:hypothetical protein [Mycobacteroides abscessus]|uniref:hypothetical protein n=1 Tax=Mycobacteroides abscessus TaxID=36809 RepID=UPI0009A6D1AD|nr:hypothetical protein [Mycobacteroides abscessus]SLC86629.1 Uncharacterised protein [Mycobacteroides abscessus subsp. abscessus]SLG75746.1 Uncharacterised protein [Mycobacteroides abscessus subsp. abscessus]